VNYFIREVIPIEIHVLIERYQIAFQRIFRNVNTMIKEHVHEDITTDQFSILQYIHQKETTTATQIAQSFGVGRSAITALVNRLVEKDFIKRKRNEEDRRIVYLSLTERGTYVVKETEKEINRFLIDKLAHFDMNDVEHFLVSLEKLSMLMENAQHKDEK